MRFEKFINGDEMVTYQEIVTQFGKIQPKTVSAAKNFPEKFYILISPEYLRLTGKDAQHHIFTAQHKSTGPTLELNIPCCGDKAVVAEDALIQRSIYLGIPQDALVRIALLQNIGVKICGTCVSNLYSG